MIIFGKPRPSLALVVVTRDGKRFNLGTQREGRLAWLSKLNQDMRIRYYIWHRTRSLSGQERADFIKLRST
jgi:hypothetical protein